MSDAASDASTKKARECYYCYEEGHVAADCSKLQAAMQAMAERECFYCKQKGHVASYCAVKAAERKAALAERECFYCKQKGHVASDCAEKKKAPERKAKCPKRVVRVPDVADHVAWPSLLKPCP